MLSSCGVADVIASSYGGRNSKCAAEFVHQILKGESPTWEDLEAKLIGGQKLQGVLTCDHVISCLNSMNLSRDKFKLFRKIHAISRLNAHPESLFDIWHTK
jgi:glycerol-3-phosphate dehydrogenase (NAD+)